MPVSSRSPRCGECWTASIRITANINDDRGFPLSNQTLKNILTAKLAEVERSGLYRRLRSVSGAQESTVTLDGLEALLLSSNNYLGLANH